MGQEKTTIVEAVKILKKAIENPDIVRLENPEFRWEDAVYNGGNCGFIIDDWRFIFFNDCGELDYTDQFESPYGVTCWFDPKNDPLEQLSTDELDQLHTILSRL